MKFETELAIVGLAVVGIGWAYFDSLPVEIMSLIVVGIAGLGGYELKNLVQNLENSIYGSKYSALKRKTFYWRKLLSTICYLTSSFLFIEHLWTHNTSWDLNFPPGHELYALIILIAGIVLGLKRK